MKKSLTLAGIVSAVLLMYLRADAKHDTKEGYQTATVVSVEKHEAAPTGLGEAPTDARLQADDYSYDIGIRLDCNVYVGRYESPIDYLPSIFVANHEVDVRMQKHVLYVSLPSSDREVKMGIVSHRRVKEPGCTTNG